MFFCWNFCWVSIHEIKQCMFTFSFSGKNKVLIRVINHTIMTDAKWFHMYLSSTLIRSRRIKEWECVCSCSLRASGFLYKMLLKTVASILLLSLDKNKGCLSMIFHLLFKKKVFSRILWNKLVHVPEVGTLLYRVGHASVA